MAVFVEVFGAFGLTISESKTETMCMPIPRAPATKIVFSATGQEYRQTTPSTYLGGTVTEILNLSDEIDRRIRARWMSFKRYKRELYDRPKASLLPLKAWMMRSEVKKCESIETTVRMRRLLWAEALLRMGDHRLPKRVMSGELENAGKRGPRGKEKAWGRTAWQMIVGYLASRGTGEPPHLTLGRGITYYTKGVVGLWPRG